MSKKPTAAQLREMSGCVCFALRRASRAVSQRSDALLRPYGLRATQVSILVAATRLEAVAMGPLAQRLGMDRTTLLRNLRPLVRRKLIEAHREAGSRRTEIRATPAGKAVVARVYPVWRRSQDRLLQLLPDRDLPRTLETLTAAVRRAPGR